MVFGRHKEVTRLGWMMRGLLSDVVTFGAIWIVPIACEDFTKNWIEWFLHSTALISVFVMEAYVWLCVRRFDVPTAEVELCNGYESLYWVFDFSNGEHGLRMGHEAASSVSTLDHSKGPILANTLCDTLQHRSRLEDEGRQRYSAQVGAWSQL